MQRDISEGQVAYLQATRMAGRSPNARPSRRDRQGPAQGGPVPARAAARARVSAWIEDYNTRRRHSALGMMSPIDYERALQAGQAA